MNFVMQHRCRAAYSGLWTLAYTTDSQCSRAASVLALDDHMQYTVWHGRRTFSVVILLGLIVILVIGDLRVGRHEQRERMARKQLLTKN